MSQKSDYPGFQVLGELYRNHTAEQIAEKYHVSRATVIGWVKRGRKEYKAYQKANPGTPLPPMFGRKKSGVVSGYPGFEVIGRLRKNHTRQQIADMFNIGYATAGDWIARAKREYAEYQAAHPDDPLPPMFEEKLGAPTRYPGMEAIARLYRDHTAAEIAEIYHIPRATAIGWINRARRKYQELMAERPDAIPQDVQEPVKKPYAGKYPGFAEIGRLYEDHTAAQIAEIYQVPVPTATRWIRLAKREYAEFRKANPGQPSLPALESKQTGRNASRREPAKAGGAA